MKKVVLLAILLLTTQSAYSAQYERSNEGIAVFENLEMARMCVRGYALATYLHGKKEYKNASNQHSIEMVKIVCVDDTLTVSLYNSMKNGSSAKTLEQSRVDAGSIIEKWFIDTIETLAKADASMKSAE